jgi:hypothetical protein
MFFSVIIFILDAILSFTTIIEKGQKIIENIRTNNKKKAENKKDKSNISKIIRPTDKEIIMYGDKNIDYRNLFLH